MRLPSISTRELRNFIWLAGSKSLKEAAEKCALSQPALSIQLKQLESKVGAQLVVRSNAQKQIELTAAGTELLTAARHALQVLQEALERIAPNAQHDKPQLRVACLPSLLQDVISPVLADLSKTHPFAQISVLDGDSSACSTLLSSKKCDVALCSRPVNGPDIKSLCLFSEQFWAVVRKDDERAARDQLTLDDFVGTTIVNLKDNHAVNASLLTRSLPCIQVNTITALESMLAQGVGAAIVAHSTALTIQHASLVKIPLRDREVSRQIFLSWTEGPATTLAGAFIERLRRQTDKKL
jgi:DNA-binding transcriptional LysR family regulator